MLGESFRNRVLRQPKMPKINFRWFCACSERPRKSWRCNSTRSRITKNILSPAGVEVSQDKTSVRSRHLLNIFSLRHRARRKLVCRCLRGKYAEAGARAVPHESPRLALTHRHRFSFMDFTTKITMLIPFPTAPRASEICWSASLCGRQS